MPRWKDLPDGLDPQVGEFVTRLRRIVDDGGASLAALAEGTGYGKASWERYLDGRLLAPKGAVVALAEVTGTDPVPLVTLWELAERAWSRSTLRHDGATEAVLLSRARTVTAPGPGTGRPAADPPAGAARTARRPVTFLAGTLGALAVTVGAFLLTDGGPAGSGRTAAATPVPSATPARGLPPGVLCAGPGCTGRDPEETGCGGEHVTTARSVTVGAALLEVRYSDTCGAAWGRIVGAVRGDTVRVTVGRVRQTGGIADAGETIAYTPMVAVREPGEMRACAELASGQRGCA
ncbi:XRE family transcriptional regulator [Streptomyces sp. Tue 6430]|nr:XRE family transcriptional regulator [Streptomyces sp. Tue 6430]